MEGAGSPRGVDVVLLGNLCVDVLVDVEELPPSGRDEKWAYLQHIKKQPTDEVSAAHISPPLSTPILCEDETTHANLILQNMHATILFAKMMGENSSPVTELRSLARSAAHLTRNTRTRTVLYTSGPDASTTVHMVSGECNAWVHVCLWWRSPSGRQGAA